jgi:hypothetical protein
MATDYGPDLARDARCSAQFHSDAGKPDRLDIAGPAVRIVRMDIGDTLLRGQQPLTRRAVLLAASAAIFPAQNALAGPPLQFGLTPVFLSNDLDLLTQLKSYLEKRTGRAVQLVQRRTYEEITSLLMSGQLDAAWICGYPFAQYRDALALVAVPLWPGYSRFARRYSCLLRSQ